MKSNDEKFISVCPVCHRGAKVKVGQAVFRGKLRWHRSISCPTCGQTEEDGDGPAPQEVRSTILEQEGTFELNVASNHKTEALRICRRLLSLSLSEVAILMRKTGPVFVGTKTESVWIGEKLAAASIDFTLSKSLEVISDIESVDS